MAAEVMSEDLTPPLSFVFTDVVGSTKLWAADPQATSRSFVIHDELVRSTVGEFGGKVFGWAGDSFRASFEEPRPALEASLALQERIAAADWNGDPPLRLRVGLNRGSAIHRGHEYFGPVVNTAARLEEIAHPGQIVAAAAAMVTVDGVPITPLGRHRVRDVPEELELFQLGEGRFAPLRTVDATLSTLPPVAEKIVGRASAIAEVRAALDGRLPVTIVGTGGCGKTRLAVEVAHLELSDHPDGCYFIDLSAVTDPKSVAPVVAASSRIKLSGGDPIAEIVAYFAERRALLVFDNCEHLVPSVQRYLQALSTGAPLLSLLATSREAIGVQGERVIPLGPLSTTNAEEPAVELFIARIRDNERSFTPDTGQRAQINEICQHLDGIPLAIELAASRAGLLGLDHVLSGMHDRFRLLSASGSDGSRTLREAIDWSFGLLSEIEQDFFVRCGVFNGSFDLAAASAVAPDLDALDVAHVLQSLSGKSLILAEGSLGGRFRLLQTIRAYALLRLGDLGLEPRLRELHFDHYVDVVATDDLDKASDLDRAIRLAPDWSNIAGALEWGTVDGRCLQAARLAVGCIGLWEESVDAIEGKRWADRILPALAVDEPVRSLLEFGLAGFEAQLDNFPRIHELMNDLTMSPVAAVRARSLTLFGYLKAREHPEASVEFFDEADRLVTEHDLGPDSLSANRWTRGGHAIYCGEFDTAQRLFDEGFTAARDTATRSINAMYCGLSLATTQILRGDPEAAVETLESYDWSGSRWDSSRVILGVALLDLGRVGDAADLIFGFAHESLLGRLRRMSNDALIGLAAMAMHRGETDHAWTLMQQAITPRTPFTIGLVEGLADRLGRGDDLRVMHRSRTVSLTELDAIDDLRAELDRLSEGLADRA